MCMNLTKLKIHREGGNTKNQKGREEFKELRPLWNNMSTVQFTSKLM